MSYAHDVNSLGFIFFDALIQVSHRTRQLVLYAGFQLNFRLFYKNSQIFRLAYPK